MQICMYLKGWNMDDNIHDKNGKYVRNIFVFSAERMFLELITMNHNMFCQVFEPAWTSAIFKNAFVRQESSLNIDRYYWSIFECFEVVWAESSNRFVFIILLAIFQNLRDVLQRFQAFVLVSNIFEFPQEFQQTNSFFIDQLAVEQQYKLKRIKIPLGKYIQHSVLNSNLV